MYKPASTLNPMTGLLLPMFAIGGDMMVELGPNVVETVPVESPVAMLLAGMRDATCEHTSVG
jgi:hypothetical protein